MDTDSDRKGGLARKLVRSHITALRGIGRAMRGEHTFRTQLALAAGSLVIAGVLRLQVIEWAILITILAMALVAEVLNTQVERALTFLHPDRHKEIERIKDIAAGAALLAWLGVLVVWVLLFGPKIAALAAS